MSGYCSCCGHDCFEIMVTNVCHNCYSKMLVKTPIICLCGSTRFKDAFIEETRNETLKGKIVLSVGLFGHMEGLDMSGETKKMLDELHLRKIDLADEVRFLNVGGYIGDSTKRELEYATKKGKIVTFLEEKK